MIQMMREWGSRCEWAPKRLSQNNYGGRGDGGGVLKVCFRNVRASLLRNEHMTQRNAANRQCTKNGATHSLRYHSKVTATIYPHGAL